MYAKTDRFCYWDAAATPQACVKESKCEHKAADKCVKPSIVYVNGTPTMCKAGVYPVTCVAATAADFLADNCFGDSTDWSYHWTGTACE
jgi:hypothetical protein